MKEDRDFTIEVEVGQNPGCFYGDQTLKIVFWISSCNFIAQTRAARHAQHEWKLN